MIQTDLRFRIFRLTLLVTGILLILQYIFGMLVNLYVQFPSTLLPHGNAWGWAFTESVSIQIHVYLGTLLLIVALVSLLLSIRIRSIAAVAASIIGFAMTILAYLVGIWFLSYGQQSASSLWMALGFLGAVLAYGVGYGATRHEKGEALLAHGGTSRSRTSNAFAVLPPVRVLQSWLLPWLASQKCGTWTLVHGIS